MYHRHVRPNPNPDDVHSVPQVGDDQSDGGVRPRRVARLRGLRLLWVRIMLYIKKEPEPSSIYIFDPYLLTFLTLRRGKYQI